MKLLFVCSRNEWRSRTAETIYKNDDRFQVKSAGTSKRARVRISEALLDWADVVFVMEESHRRMIYDKFQPGYRDDKEIVVLDILDEYKYMDPDLIAELRDQIDAYFR